MVNLTYIALHNSLSIKRFHFTASNQKTVADFGNRRARGGGAEGSTILPKKTPGQADFSVEVTPVLRVLGHPAAAEKQGQSPCSPFPYRTDDKSGIKCHPSEAAVTYPGPLPNGVLPAKLSFAISAADIDRNGPEDGVRQIECKLMPQYALLSPAPEKAPVSSTVREAVIAGGLRAEIAPSLQEDANALYLDAGEGA